MSDLTFIFKSTMKWWRKHQNFEHLSKSWSKWWAYLCTLHICRLRLAFVVYLFAQIVHLYDFLFLWLIAWRFSRWLWSVVYLHLRHLNNFAPDFCLILRDTISLVVPFGFAQLPLPIVTTDLSSTSMFSSSVESSTLMAGEEYVPVEIVRIVSLTEREKLRFTWI